MIDVMPGTVAVYGDVGCPWAHAAVYRLHATRARLGLEDRVVFDNRAFPLELVNRQATPKRVLDAEIPVVGALEPDAGWQMWQADAHEWPVTTLLALEAVEAAKEQSLAASETLDRALRVALFGQSRCISLFHEILDVATACGQLDEGKLQEALVEGRARRAVFECQQAAETGDVKGSPHLFLADGSNVHNPGIAMEWQGEHGRGFPVVSRDDPSIYDDLIRRAAATTTDTP